MTGGEDEPEHLIANVVIQSRVEIGHGLLLHLHVQGDVFGSARFGFGVYKRTFSGWEISVREADGTELTRCTLASRSVHC